MAERPKTVGLMQDVFAADGDMAQGPVFCAHPIGRSPQANAGFQKVGERGASVLNKTRKQRSAFFENLSARVCG